jgi:hypothetical protein
LGPWVRFPPGSPNPQDKSAQFPKTQPAPKRQSAESSPVGSHHVCCPHFSDRVKGQLIEFRHTNQSVFGNGAPVRAVDPERSVYQQFVKKPLIACLMCAPQNHKERRIRPSRPSAQPCQECRPAGRIRPCIPFARSGATTALRVALAPRGLDDLDASIQSPELGQVADCFGPHEARVRTSGFPDHRGSGADWQCVEAVQESLYRPWLTDAVQDRATEFRSFVRLPAKSSASSHTWITDAGGGVRAWSGVARHLSGCTSDTLSSPATPPPLLPVSFHGFRCRDIAGGHQGICGLDVFVTRN